jgi:hypothetical protein
MSIEHRDAPPKSYAVQLVVAWGIVGVPLLWGVAQTAANALKLFQ